MDVSECSTGKKESIWTRTFILLLIANIFLSTSFHMISTTMTMYCLEIVSSEATAGFVVGIFSVASLLIRPFCGPLIDAKSKKTIYLASLVLLTLTVFAYSYAADVVVLSILRFIHGFGFGFATTTSLAMASASAPAGKSASCLGTYGIASSVATAIAPNLGISIANAYGFPVMFRIASLLSALSLLCAFLVKGKWSTFSAQKFSLKGLKIDSIFSKKVLSIALMLVILGMANSTISSFLSTYSKGLGIQGYATYFTVSACTMLITRPAAGRLTDRYGIKKVIVPASLFLAAAFVILSMADSLYILWLAAFCFGIGYGSLQPSLQAYAFSRESPERRGVTSSTVSVGVDIGNGLGAYAAGVAVSAFGYRIMFGASVIYAVLLLVVFLADERKIG